MYEEHVKSDIVTPSFSYRYLNYYNLQPVKLY